MRFNPADLVYLMPMITLVITGLVLILAEAFLKDRKNHTALMGLATAGAVGAGLVAIMVYRHLGDGETRSLMSGMLLADKTTMLLVAMFSFTTAAAAMIAPANQREHDWEMGEFYGILLLSASGMVILAQAGNLVTVFLGVETMSIGVYVLTASRKRSRRAQEAAMKYFLMGAFATAFLIYGMALVYGATGTTDLLLIKARAADSIEGGLLIAGMFLLIVAFAFKVAAIPFHMWAPDAYEGAPSPVTGFMAAAVKSAAIVAMLRIFGDVLGGDVMPFGKMGWASPLVVMAALTITIGNLAALKQDNIKRMLAYSSISHAGVILTGVAAVGLGATSARPAVVFYLLAYSVTTMGAFAIVSWIGSRGRERVLIEDWAGMGVQKPGFAAAMTVFLLSLGGLPPTAGFFAKFYIFKSAMDVPDQQLLWLVVIGVVNSAISIFYYLRVVQAMYFKPAADELKPVKSGALTFVVILAVFLVLEMGLMPGTWLGWIH